MSNIKLSKDALKPFAGRWVAVIGQRIVSQGGTPTQVLRSVGVTRYKEKPIILFVPMNRSMQFSAIFYRVRELLPKEECIYLVGGAVRDALLRRPTRDLDFTVCGDVKKIAKSVADGLNGALYYLDEEREMMRVLYKDDNGEHVVMDFARMQGSAIDDDLLARDFTINAMAVEVHNPEQLLDPLSGAQDLIDKRLRLCSPHALDDDPIRVLRGIRFAATLQLHIPKELRAAMRRAVKGLKRVSAERVRDELLTIFQGKRVSPALRALEMVGALAEIVPALEELKSVQLSSFGGGNAWELTLSVITKLEELINVLDLDFHPQASSNYRYGLVSLRLGRFRQHLHRHLNREVILGRRVRALIFWAALFHQFIWQDDVIRSGGEADGRHQPEFSGRELIENIARGLKLSNDEVEWVLKIIQNQAFPEQFDGVNNSPGRLDIYRFFKETGEAGVDVCLLSLAIRLAREGSAISQDEWIRQVDVVRTMLEAWWEKYETEIAPPKYLSGKDIIALFDVSEGPLIGKLLERVTEAQILGEVSSKEDAIRYIREVLLEGV